MTAHRKSRHDAAADVFTSGTAISAPVLPMAILVVSFLLVRGSSRWSRAGLVGFSIVALLLFIGGLGEAFASGTPDTPKTVLVGAGVFWALMAIIMVSLVVASFRDSRRV